MTEWKQRPDFPNEILYRKDFFCSYNPNRKDARNPLDWILEAIAEISIPADPETALVMPRDDKTFGKAYYILIGDHREAYSKLQTLDEAYAYFLTNLDKMHPCSDKPLEAVIN